MTTTARHVDEQPVAAREPQEQALAGVLAGRCGTAVPDVRQATRTERQAVFTQWADSTLRGTPPGRLSLHHTSQRPGDTMRRFRRLAMRRASDPAPVPAAVPAAVPDADAADAAAGQRTAEPSAVTAEATAGRHIQSHLRNRPPPSSGNTNTIGDER